MSPHGTKSSLVEIQEQSHQAKASPLNPLDLIVSRMALGSFATGVAKMTTANEQSQSVELICNLSSSVSLDQQLVSWSLRQPSGLFAVIRDADGFAIKVLRHD